MLLSTFFSIDKHCVQDCLARSNPKIRYVRLVRLYAKRADSVSPRMDGTLAVYASKCCSRLKAEIKAEIRRFNLSGWYTAAAGVIRLSIAESCCNSASHSRRYLGASLGSILQSDRGHSDAF